MHYSTQRKPRLAAFTLIELLVVIAIVGVLLSVLMPSLSQARETARSTTCLANERSIGQLVMYYANDYRNYTPALSSPYDTNDPTLPNIWFTKLIHYYLGRQPETGWGTDYRYGTGRGPEKLFTCPTDPEMGKDGLNERFSVAYGWNYLALTHLDRTNLTSDGNSARFSQIERPGETIMAADSNALWTFAYIIKPQDFKGYYSAIHTATYRHNTNANFVFADGHAASLGPETTMASDRLWRIWKDLGVIP